MMATCDADTACSSILAISNQYTTIATTTTNNGLGISGNTQTNAPTAATSVEKSTIENKFNGSKFIENKFNE
jgi:hypothetical protein